MSILPPAGQIVIKHDVNMESEEKEVKVEKAHNVCILL